MTFKVTGGARDSLLTDIFCFRPRCPPGKISTSQCAVSVRFPAGQHTRHKPSQRRRPCRHATCRVPGCCASMDDMEVLTSFLGILSRVRHLPLVIYYREGHVVYAIGGRESRCHLHGKERPGGLKQEGRLDGGPPPVGVVVPGLSRIPFKAHGKLADFHPSSVAGTPSGPNHAPPQPRSAWDGIQSLTFGSIAIGGARKALAEIYTGNCGFGKGYPEIVPSGSPCASGREIPVPCRKGCGEVVPNSELGWCRMWSNMRVLRETFNFHDNWSSGGIQFKLPRPLFMTSSGVTSLWRHFSLHRSKCSGRNLFRSCDFWPCVDTLTLSPPLSESDALEGIRLTGTELYFRKAKRQLQLQRLGIQLNLGLLTQG